MEVNVGGYVANLAPVDGDFISQHARGRNLN